MKKIECCPTCHQLIPKEKNDPLEGIVCSEYHVLCKICRYPVAKSIMKEDGICGMCHKAADKLREKKRLKVV